MCDCNRRGFIWGASGFGAVAFLSTGAFAAQSADAKPKVYTCPPCGCPNDGKDFPEPGACSVCAMPLMEKPPAPLEKPQTSEPAQRPAEPKAQTAEPPAKTAPPQQRPSPE